MEWNEARKAPSCDHLGRLICSLRSCWHNYRDELIHGYCWWTSGDISEIWFTYSVKKNAKSKIRFCRLVCSRTLCGKDKKKLNDFLTISFIFNTSTEYELVSLISITNFLVWKWSCALKIITIKEIESSTEITRFFSLYCRK